MLLTALLAIAALLVLVLLLSSRRSRAPRQAPTSAPGSADTSHAGEGFRPTTFGARSATEEEKASETEAPRLDENVQFTVYRPEEISPARWYPFLAFVHLAERRPDEPESPDPIAEVKRQAERLLEDVSVDYDTVRSDSLHAVPRSGEITLVPQMDGVEFNPPRCTFRWEQPVHRAEFQLRALAGAVPRTARGRLTIFWGALIVGDVPLTIAVVERAGATRPRLAEGSSRPYRNVFPSYAHRDAAVVEHFNDVLRSFGDRYLRDVSELRAGQVWSEELQRLIERADVFQLFWSWNALDSRFVRQEWEFALGLGRPNFVRPVYWEDPLPSTGDLPPETLRRLHFHRLGSLPTAVEREVVEGAKPEGPRGVRLTPKVTAIAATIIVVLATAPLLLDYQEWEAGETSGSSSAPPPPATTPQVDPDDRPLPIPKPTITPGPTASEGRSGGPGGIRVQIPQAVLAEGRTLAAGTYDVRVIDAETTGDQAGSRVELLRDGKIVAGGVAALVPSDQVNAMAGGDAPRRGQARAQRVRGESAVRIWINRDGKYFVVQLPVK